jgi:hypothetical protein
LAGAVPYQGPLGVLTHDPATAEPSPCSRFFTAATVDLFAGAVCTWISGTELRVGPLPEAAPAAPGALVVLLDDTIFALSADGYSPAATGTVFLIPPLDAPQVQVLGARTTDACTDIELDASPSRAAPRPTFAWRALALRCRDGPCDGAAVEAASKQRGARFRVDARTFPADFAELDVEVTVTSAWGQSASARTTVAVTSRPGLRVAIDGGLDGPYTARGVALYASITETQCNTTAAGPGESETTMIWSVFTSARLTSAPATLVTSVAAAELLLPPRLLDPGLYFVQVEVLRTRRGETLAGAATEALTVRSTKPIVRTLPPLQGAGVGEPVVVQA